MSDKPQPRLLMRRAEAFVLDTIVTPLALGLCVGLPLSAIIDFGPFTNHVILAPSVLVFVWAIVTEAALGRSGGKGAVGLQIVRVARSSPHALLIRAGIKWTPLLLAATLRLWVDGLNLFGGSAWMSTAPFILIPLWVAVLSGSATSERGWIDRRSGTRVIDGADVEGTERGFEVKT